MNDKIRAKLSLLPELPGCYVMKNKENEIIYIGKAKKLVNRVSSYFNRPHEGKTQKMVSEIEDFDYIVTSSEKEAFILEMNLIHKHYPKYNILLKDGKTYPYIQITSHRHPMIKIARNLKDKKAIYFGPYPDSSAAYEIINLLNRLFPLRKCNTLPKKPCLYYYIGQCLAPCINEVSKEQYDQIISEIKAFLKGDTSKLKSELATRMYEHSEKLEFERANEYKKLIESIDYVTTKQHVSFKEKMNIDVFAFHTREDYISISTLMYREGILLTKINHVLPYYDDVEDAFINYVYNFYQDHIIPKQIVMPDLNGVDLLSEVLEVDIITPSRGTRQELLTIAAQNAIEAMKQKFALTFDDDKDKIELLDEFASLIGVSSLHQIEMVDISHLQGSDAVGAVVVFTNGEPNKREYRRYKINQENTKDDTASMYEVMYRRYYRRLTEQGKYSNLIIVDGGIMQINAVKKVFDALNINIKVVGLVKDEHHRTRALVDSDGKEISLTDNKQLLFLLTRMQDEVHRFAIAYHHNLRRKSMTLSILDEVPGIGEKRKHKLIRAFGSVEKMKEVPLSELEQYLPHEVAVNLKQKLDNQ